MHLQDRTAIVTGASSGIGAATAEALGREGCNVALAARREDRLREVAEGLEGDRTIVVPTDVTEADDLDRLVERTVEAFGGLDLLVNNAGVLYATGVGDWDREQARQQVEVNQLGAMNLTHAAMDHLLDAELGDVITVSSLNAVYPAAKGSAYTASKFGINGFHRSLRKDLGQNDVRVTVVMPGPVITEMNDWADWDGRALEAADVAEAVVFAASRPPHVEIEELHVDSTDKFD